MPSRLGYVIGTLLMVLGPLAAVVVVVLAVLDAGGARDGDTRVSIPGERTVQLDDQKYIVYYEERSSATDSSPPLQISVTPVQGGAPLPVSDYATDLTVSSGGRSGVAIATIEPPAEGDYRFAVAPGGQGAVPGSSAVLGEPFVARLALTIVGTALLFLLPLLVGGLIVLVTFLRRRRAKPPSGPPAAWPPAPGPFSGA